MIRVLEKKLADKIAAGEVIDRPVSIVKELVENSLDAGASSITVEIRGGGKDYLRVSDNGCGINAGEVETAFLRHATSKISSEDDLKAIGTLGFRGEALASICAVSRTEMITRNREDKTGRHLIVEGSRIIINKATGCPDGTTITVQDLFFNLPARKKFLGSDSGESRRITDLLSRMALCYPDVRFRLINGKKDVFQTSGNGIILDSILRIYGRDLEKDLLPVDGKSSQGFILRGFVSGPGLSSNSRNRQIFCINGRIVSSRTMERGLEKAYRERLFTGRFPIAFLFLSIPPEKLDVNIHPTKKEVRFDDPFLVEDFIEEQVGKALKGKASIPEAEIQPRKETGIQSRSETAETGRLYPDPAQDDPGGSGVFTGDSEGRIENDQVDISRLLQSMREQQIEEEKPVYTAQKDEPESTETARNEFPLSDLDILGVAMNTYIIAVHQDTIYLIDQHAAHERIYYERFLREYHGSDKTRQTLLLPLQFTVSADVEDSEGEWIDHVRSLGYDIEYFGDRTYIVREMPAFLEGEEGEAFLRRFFIELEERPDLRDFPTLDKLIMRSCKSAVKGGDKLHSEEIHSLLRQLEDCDNPYSCPHGRPTFLKLGRRELERMFKRA